MNSLRRSTASKEQVLETGHESFSIESRIIREFGERLVKHPEVALLELIKNAYDADAETCKIEHRFPERLSVIDSGHGMTLREFKRGWMRIGTSSKALNAESRRLSRRIVGEKGIGRFAVRYLGRHLQLVSVAYDAGRDCLTRLEATFDWPKFDKDEDLGIVKVPYRLVKEAEGTATGTTLTITELRANTNAIDFREVLTGSLGLLSPYHALLRKNENDEQADLPDLPDIAGSDPGFNVLIDSPEYSGDESASASILKHFVFRCVVSIAEGRIKLRLYRRGEKKPWLRINDRYKNDLGQLYADLRFFPQRKGTYSNLPVDGRLARTWVKSNSGIAVFDKNFRVLPYGTQGDDWLSLASDTAKNVRNPRSSVAQRHFPMDEETRKSTQLNYMLRLPYPDQLVGAVQVFGVRTSEQSDDDEGLVATADRQGFVDNQAYSQLFDIIRGAAEAIAYGDRELKREEDAKAAADAAKVAQDETRQAIAQVKANPNLTSEDKSNLVKHLVSAQEATKRYEDISKTRESALEIMSLLGVVAGFMTHEFGTAITRLERSHSILRRLAKHHDGLDAEAEAIAKHIRELKEFVAYSKGYVKGASIIPQRGVPARPRILQVTRTFGKYADDRRIKVSVDVAQDVATPRVPISLYSGIVLNLYTNALKAVTAKATRGPREIAIRAWNKQNVHILQVSDTGVGIPTTLEKRIFDPLFTTTSSNRDPLGSGMGLGLSLVQRGAKAYDGTVQVVKPPPGFATCFEARFPLQENE